MTLRIHDISITCAFAGARGVQEQARRAWFKGRDAESLLSVSHVGYGRTSTTKYSQGKGYMLFHVYSNFFFYGYQSSCKIIGFLPARQYDFSLSYLTTDLADHDLWLSS